MSKARVGHWVSIGGCRGSVSAPFAFRCVNSLSPKQTDPTGGRPTIALGAGGRSLARDGQHQHLQGPRFMQKCLGYLGSWFGVLRAIQPDCFLVATAVLLGLASLHLADQDRIIHDMTDQARHISQQRYIASKSNDCTTQGKYADIQQGLGCCMLSGAYVSQVSHGSIYSLTVQPVNMS